MCGIAGILSLKGRIGKKETLECRKMTALLRHRGPDSTGFLDDSRCCIGNSRLKVMDPGEAADLPMSSEDGKVWMAYNGEITNYLELRGLSCLKPAAFRTASDSEVLLRLYQAEGAGFVKRLSGMFAVFIYDKARGMAHLIRDPWGLRPLFYMIAGGKLYFSSEIKAFTAAGGFEHSVDREGLYHYFSLGYFPGGHTPFACVRELRGGEMISVRLGKGSFRVEEYERIVFKEGVEMSLEAVKRRFLKLFRDSVRRNLRSDAPVGLALSGGHDSSSILAMAKLLGVSEKLHTFSLKIDSPTFDESKYQRAMARFAGSVHHEIRIGARAVREELMRHIAYMDEPISDGSAIPMLIMCREAKKFIKVMLSGEGGDEISNAYETYRAYKAAALYRKAIPGLLRKAVRLAAGMLPVSYGKLSLDFVAKRFVEGAEMDVPSAHLYWRHVLDEKDKAGLLVYSDYPRTSSLFSELYESAGCEEPLNRLALVDMRYFFIGDLMLKNDRMFMANSIEARFPFMDRHLLEFACSIPVRHKIRGFNARYFQKEAMKRYYPEIIYSRKNFGIEIPYSKWLLNELRDIGERYFSGKAAACHGLFRREFVEDKWKRHLSGREDNGRFLWSLLSFLVWHELFVEKRNFERYLA